MAPKKACSTLRLTDLRATVPAEDWTVLHGTGVIALTSEITTLGESHSPSTACAGLSGILDFSSRILNEILAILEIMGFGMQWAEAFLGKGEEIGITSYLFFRSFSP